MNTTFYHDESKTICHIDCVFYTVSTFWTHTHTHTHTQYRLRVLYCVHVLDVYDSNLGSRTSGMTSRCTFVNGLQATHPHPTTPTTPGPHHNVSGLDGDATNGCIVINSTEVSFPDAPDPGACWRGMRQSRLPNNNFTLSAPCGGGGSGGGGGGGACEGSLQSWHV